jgi:hypothetical protein
MGKSATSCQTYLYRHGCDDSSPGNYSSITASTVQAAGNSSPEAADPCISPAVDAKPDLVPLDPRQRRHRRSSTHIAITLRLSSEVAAGNARLLAISFSREILKQYVGFTLETKMFSFGSSGTSLSFRRRLMLSRNCCWVILHPHIVGTKPYRMGRRRRQWRL